MYVLRTPIASGANLVGKVYTIVELKQRGSVITDWPTFLKFLQWSAQLSLFLAFVDLFDWFCGRLWKFLSCFGIVTCRPGIDQNTNFVKLPSAKWPFLVYMPERIYNSRQCLPLSVVQLKGKHCQKILSFKN